MPEVIRERFLSRRTSPLRSVHPHTQRSSSLKTSAEIVAHLQELRAASLVRPDMYAASPEALEDVLSLIDRLLQFIDPAVVAGRGYSEFLQARGFGSANFCSRRRPHNLTPDDRELFRELAEFWQEYLNSLFVVP